MLLGFRGEQPWDTMLWNNYRKNHFWKEMSRWFKFKMIAYWFPLETKLNLAEKEKKSQEPSFWSVNLTLTNVVTLVCRVFSQWLCKIPVCLIFLYLRYKIVGLFTFPLQWNLKRRYWILHSALTSWQQTTVIQMTGGKASFTVRLTGSLLIWWLTVCDS